MKNSWLVWVFVVGVIVTMLVAFNYQGAQDTVPLSEIFPETETYPIDVEFVDSDGNTEKVMQYAVESDEPLVERKVVEVDREDMKKSQTIVKPPIAVIEKKPVEKVEATPPPVVAKVEEKKPVEPVELTSTTAYTIQVASFKDKAKAQKKVDEVVKKDYSAFLVAKDLKGKGTYYRVYVGQFEDKKEANQHLSKVKKDYSGSFVISTK